MKYNSTPENEGIDELFAKQFKNLEVPPSNHSWTDIQDTLDNGNIDQVFRHHLREIEQTPSPEVWEKVKPRLPLNLFVRTHLNWLSKIAAVLVLGMSAVYLSIENPYATNSTMVDLSPNLIPDGTLNNGAVVEKEAFVFDIPIEEEVAETPLHQAFSEATEAQEEADEFLASLLEDEEEFEIDDQKIMDILKPIEQLPIENIAAMLHKKEPIETAIIEEIEMQINIPLKVVEDDEIDKMINYYDQQNGIQQK